MYWTFYNSTDDKMKNFAFAYSNILQQQTQDTFKALVDAIIPRTPRLAEVYGEFMFFGALDYQTYEFLILSLDNYYIPLAEPTAVMLDVVAELLLNIPSYKGGGTFAAISPINRFLVLSRLEELEFHLIDLPMTFKEHPEFILSISSSLNRITMMGYYSEWFGYGSTRLMEPNQRVLEFSPSSWTQVGYPGPSFSYRAQVLEYYKRRAEHEQ